MISGFLDGRISGSIDVYKSKTNDMLLNRSLPYMTGFSEAKFNAGEVMNRGVELSLNTVNINGDGKDNFRWESGLTFYRNKNKIVHLLARMLMARKRTIRVMRQQMVTKLLVRWL